MTETKFMTEQPPVVLHTRPVLEMDEEQFFEFCQLNRHWRIERSAEGDLEVMVPYTENGARLGWLIDPEERKVHVYKPNEPAEVLDNPDRLSGEPALPGFVLGLTPIWEPGF